MHGWKVLNKLTVGYIVANDLKYHEMCLVICRWRSKTDTPGTTTCHQDTCNKVIEEVLAMIDDEDISAGRACSIYIRGNMSTKEVLWRRHRRKSHTTEGYSYRKVSSPERRIWFRRDVMLVPASALKHRITTSPYCN